MAAGSTILGFPIAWDFTTATNDKEAPSFQANDELTVVFNVAPDVATLTWPAATDNVGVTEYLIYKDNLEVATVDGDVFTYNVAGLIPGTEYNFAIVARDYLQNISSGLQKLLPHSATPVNLLLTVI